MTRGRAARTFLKQKERGLRFFDKYLHRREQENEGGKEEGGLEERERERQRGGKKKETTRRFRLTPSCLIMSARNYTVVKIPLHSAPC